MPISIPSVKQIGPFQKTQKAASNGWQAPFLHRGPHSFVRSIQAVKDNPRLTSSSNNLGSKRPRCNISPEAGSAECLNRVHG